MKAITTILILSVLLAASSFATELSGPAKSSGALVVGTLADANNPVEMALAPEYTRLAVVRQRMARLLRSAVDGDDIARASIVLEAAVQVQRLTDNARTQLDSLATWKRDDGPFRAELETARDTIRRAESVYDQAKKGELI